MSPWANSNLHSWALPAQDLAGLGFRQPLKHEQHFTFLGRGYLRVGWLFFREGGGKLVIFSFFLLFFDREIDINGKDHKIPVILPGMCFRELEYHGTHLTWNLPWRLILGLRTVKISKASLVHQAYWSSDHREGGSRACTASLCGRRRPPSHPVERLSSRVQREEGMISISFFLRGEKKRVHLLVKASPVAPQKGFGPHPLGSVCLAQ